VTTNETFFKFTFEHKQLAHWLSWYCTRSTTIPAQFSRGSRTSCRSNDLTLEPTTSFRSDVEQGTGKIQKPP